MSNLPTGTVTFLLTDIQGSTRLWEQHPDAMQQAMSRHDALIEECVQQQNGILVRPRGEGDSRFAVFTNVSDAVTCAAVIQVCLHEEVWPLPDPLRVRIALHTGKADLRMGDYYGSAVNRCARLRGIAYGGQTLLSAATVALVGDHLPDGLHLKDLGLHRLKDLDRSEHIHQLIVPGLPEEFPALQSLDAFPNNLPLQLTSFIGRERELSEIKDLLSRTRLLTLTGSGGAGKTRLALQVAADLLESYPDGAWLVELATTTDPALVPNALANVLGVREWQNRALKDVLVDYVRDKRMLIVFDNCEHLLLACAELADVLLRSCPGVKLLTTSREALGVMGETSWRVPSLGVPNPQLLEPMETLNRCEAVQLFLERAKAVRPDFELTSENAHPVAQICFRLDGIPLAIELATTRIRSMSAAQIADRLDDRFRLLTGGSRTALPRQQTLRTMIDWSYGLLSEPERVLLRRLSVFVGGWTLESCEAICAGETLESLEVMDLHMQLVNKSLVVMDEQGRETRYQMLETIRQYAREKLLDSGEVVLLRNRHLECYVQAAEEIGADPWNRFKKSIIDRIAAEGGNFRSAMEWGLENNLEACLHLGGTLVPAMRYTEGYSEWRTWLEMGLGKVDDSNGAFPAMVRAKALVGIGITCLVQGNNLSAKAFLEESVALMRKIGDKKELAFALGSLAAACGLSGDSAHARSIGQESLELSAEIGDTHGLSQGLIGAALYAYYTDDFTTARTKFEQSVALAREHGDRWNVAWPLVFFGKMSLQLGERAAARSQLEECATLFRELDDKLGIGQALTALAQLETHEGNADQAVAYYKECLEIWRKVGNRGAAALVLQLQGHMALEADDYELARTLFERCLVIRRQLDDPREVGGPLEGLASLAMAQGNWSRAVRLIGAAEVIRGESAHNMESFDAAKIEHLVATIHEHLTQSEFDEQWAEGKALGVEQAINYALDKTSA